jgi:hypothetical protein
MPRPGTRPKSREKKLFDEQIRDTARKHFAEDFPNPERRGCPPTGEIEPLADKPLEGRNWVLDHLRHCSMLPRPWPFSLQRAKKEEVPGQMRPRRLSRLTRAAARSRKVGLNNSDGCRPAIWTFGVRGESGGFGRLPALSSVRKCRKGPFYGRFCQF